MVAREGGSLEFRPVDGGRDPPHFPVEAGDPDPHLFDRGRAAAPWFRR